MKISIINIKQLIQVRESSVLKVSGDEMSYLPIIENAFLLIENDIIIAFGRMEDYVSNSSDKVMDASDKIVMPTWCDSHTHIVYAGHREQEFVDRIKGLSYTEIANRGGGILNSASKLQNTTENELYEESIIRVKQVIKQGTGAIEIKSGYGLTTESELKMLRVIKRIKENFPLKVKATFLGAHAIPNAYKTDKKGYIDLIITKMLPEIATENLADFIDVFCEKGYFSVEDTDEILSAGKKYGLIPKLHVNQFNAFGGVAIGVKHHAISVDHLEELNLEDITVLKDSQTMPVALPSCSYFLSIPYTPARQIIDAGLPLALATDYNPGSSPSGNMNFVVSTACIKMNMTPEEAINAATINGAYAMGISNEYGSIAIGKKANIIITNPIPNYSYLPYAFGENHIGTVILNGTIIK
jgi:imidazolonepropionase